MISAFYLQSFDDIGTASIPPGENVNVAQVFFCRIALTYSLNHSVSWCCWALNINGLNDRGGAFT